MMVMMMMIHDAERNRFKTNYIWKRQLGNATRCTRTTSSRQ